MKKTLLFASAFLLTVSQAQSFFPLWTQERERQKMKKELDLNMESKHADIVGKDAIKDTISLNHLKTFVKAVCAANLHKSEANIGTTVQAPDNTLIALINHNGQKYAFHVRNTPQSQRTVCDKNNYVLYGDKQELLNTAKKLHPEIDEEAIKKFAIYLERIAINRKIDEIKNDHSMNTEKKEQLIETALAKLETLK